MSTIAQKLVFEREAMAEVCTGNESVPVCEGKLRRFAGCAGKSCTKRRESTWPFERNLLTYGGEETQRCYQDMTSQRDPSGLLVQRWAGQEML